MEENQEDKRLEQLDKESSKPLTQNIPSVQENESNTERQDSEEGEIKTTSQRRPQFRFSENNRRLFS